MTPASRCGSRAGAGVQGKEDEHDMAKTTRKTEPTNAEKQPAVRRARAAAPAADERKTATRARKKTDGGAAAIPAKTGREVANVGQSLQEPAIPAEPTHDEIALRAWSIYEGRGGGHGQAFDDWVEARRQLFAERGLEE
jgi:hypothetical protein